MSYVMRCIVFAVGTLGLARSAAAQEVPQSLAAMRQAAEAAADIEPAHTARPGVETTANRGAPLAVVVREEVRVMLRRAVQAELKRELELQASQTRPGGERGQSSDSGRETDPAGHEQARRAALQAQAARLLGQLYRQNVSRASADAMPGTGATQRDTGDTRALRAK